MNLKSRIASIGIFTAALLALAGCELPQVSRGEISITVRSDGTSQVIEVREGSTVQEALQIASVELSDSDRTVPPRYSILTTGDEIEVIRIVEQFDIQEVVIPFEHQELRSESLSTGETQLLQAGQNGLKQVTTRTVLEDGIEVSQIIVQETVLLEPIPEIVMIGVQASYAPLNIPGKLVYLAGGNAWLMEGSTANRIPLVTTGDLDGRIFALSSDGDFLLFSRKSDQPPEEEINTLWVVPTEQDEDPIDLEVSNVVHFAAWVPRQGQTIAYSTVEPRLAAPGWQANNDLHTVSFSVRGFTGNREQLLEANDGGVYGWWGSMFAFSPNGWPIAYSRPDGIGFVEDNDRLTTLIDITPLQTRSDWAWIPGLTWSPDGVNLYLVTHAPSMGLVSAEESPYFDLVGVSLESEAYAQLTPQVGMFAYPSCSPIQQTGVRKDYKLAYMQAIFPEQSDTSRYRLVIMDRDGSNRLVLFPSEGVPGLEPQIPIWAPELINSVQLIALRYQGNLWLVDTDDGQAYQITGDGLIAHLDWK